MAIDILLRRHFWAVILALVAVVAFLDALAVMRIVGTNLSADARSLEIPPLLARLAPGAPAASLHTNDANPILHRNAFDSTTGPLDRDVDTAGSLDGLAPAGVDDPFHAPACDGLTAVVIAASTDPDYSFAALETPGDKGKRLLRRRGQELGGKTVAFVGWDRVWMSSGDRLCQARMFAGPAASAPPPAASASSGGSTVTDDIRRGIEKIGPREFNVDRGVIDKILENQALLMRQVRIELEEGSGKVVGLKVLGVKPDSLLGTLGMENGDRLERINGFDITTPQSALEAYGRLPAANHLTVLLNRKGSEVNVDYNIR